VKAIMVMFDSLNRRMLPPYGDSWVHAPNFSRLAKRSAVFDSCFVGSMPCIPARRELHTGRYNFLHRSWGPLEPFDDSMPELLKKNGVYTHLATDHQHYFEDGGATYHHRYNTWEFFRGQEGDCWKGEVHNPDIPENIRRLKKPIWRQDWVNRQYIQDEQDYPQAQTFAAGLEFIRKNYQQDRWFLQIETFDPHEPFFVPQRFLDLYPHEYRGPHFDWPDYALVTETEEQVRHLQYQYAALVSMCDEHLGKVLDLMDELDLWEDTLLIVTTDHGILLGERETWLKNIQPLYNEIAQIPLFIWDPRSRTAGERRSSLVQTIDIAPTILEFFNIPRPLDMQGEPLVEAIDSDSPVREAALFGYHGGHINVTDRRYVYMRGPARGDNEPLFQYTLMPTHIKSMFSVDELQNIQLAEPFSFTKGCRTMKIAGMGTIVVPNPFLYGTQLFDLESDPRQENPIHDPEVELRLLKQMIALMQENETPAEQYERMGLPPSGEVNESHLALEQDRPTGDYIGTTKVAWQGQGEKMFHTLLHLIPYPVQRQVCLRFEAGLRQEGYTELDEDLTSALMLRAAPAGMEQSLKLFAELVVKTSKRASAGGGE
jgi:arylsulfatase A-like enzyme